MSRSQLNLEESLKMINKYSSGWERAGITGVQHLRKQHFPFYLSSESVRDKTLSMISMNGSVCIRTIFDRVVMVGALAKHCRFRHARFVHCNLTNINLTRTDFAVNVLSGCFIKGAKLAGAALPSPAVILQAAWEEVPDRICLALMRLDCENIPNGTRLFNAWARGGACPYSLQRFSQRIVSFFEERHLWKPGPAPTQYQAAKMLLDHFCPDWKHKS